MSGPLKESAKRSATARAERPEPLAASLESGTARTGASSCLHGCWISTSDPAHAVHPAQPGARHRGPFPGLPGEEARVRPCPSPLRRPGHRCLPPPRVRFKDWLQKTATLSLFQVRGGFYEGIARHCPDEEAERRLKRSTPSALAPGPSPSWRTSPPPGPEGPLTETGSDAIRRSGADRGMGRLVDMPAQTLPQLARDPLRRRRPRRRPTGQVPRLHSEEAERTVNCLKRLSCRSDSHKKRRLRIRA